VHSDIFTHSLQSSRQHKSLKFLNPVGYYNKHEFIGIIFSISHVKHSKISGPEQVLQLVSHSLQIFKFIQ